MPVTYTPVRYPGGKTKLYPEIKAILEENDLIGCAYSEVFAGGAGLAMKLLLKGDVSSVTINDYDRAVYCMWNMIVNHAGELCEFIDDAVLDANTWLHHREVYRHRDTADSRDLGCSTFYLNRTNVSGILSGGLIGGLEQTGNFKMDARFRKQGLKKKIQTIAARRDDIAVTCLDASDFIDTHLADSTLFAYFDPPYVQKGPGLYKSSFDEVGHRSLAAKISSCPCKWVVTYDADNLIDKIYADYKKNDMDITYTANLKTVGKEKIILGPGLRWPQ